MVAGASETPSLTELLRISDKVLGVCVCYHLVHYLHPFSVCHAPGVEPSALAGSCCT